MSLPDLSAHPAPQRIVCLTEEPTEILCALGEAERIVGISAYTVRPPWISEARPVVSAFVGGSVERIAALDPDLVIGFSDVQADYAGTLIRAGLNVIIFNQRSLSEILSMIQALGNLVGAGDRAATLVDSYRAGLQAAAARTAATSAASRPRVYFEEWDEPMIAGIRWVDELIAIAGGRNVFADRATSAAAAGRVVNARDVVDAAPDLVLASWCGKPFDQAAFEARPGFAQLPAVRAGQVHELDPSIILQPGPAALTDGLAALEAHIRPLVSGS